MTDNKELRHEKPNMLVTYSEKTAKNNKWFKECVDYYLSCSRFRDGQAEHSLDTLYEAYNGKFPEQWFKHVTDPYKTGAAQPAKIRPVSVIRTNLDQLISEFNRRPLRYMVVNSTPEGYDSYNEEMTAALQDNIKKHFDQALKAMGVMPTAAGEEPKEIPLPEAIIKTFKSSWRDQLAIAGQAWLEDAYEVNYLKEKWLRMFKHWIIAGEAYSFKGVYNGKMHYKDVSPRDIDYARSESKTFVEESDWVVCRHMMSVSDVVSLFYSEVKSQELEELADPIAYTPQAFFTALHNGGSAITTQYGNLIPVYHIQWTAYKKIKIVQYLDPETMMLVEREVDEDDIIDPNTEKVIEEYWLPEKYEGWRLSNDVYAFLQPVAVQRTDGGLVSDCKNGYNGRTYSDLHSSNVSLMMMGMPFQLMCMIINYKIEYMVSKSKGKIVLLDKNVIPKKGGWNDDRFFHYAEGKGWGLIDRSQVGVDKSFNQYQVVDLSMYDNIKQLIELYQYYKQQWDEILGMTPQRKGQMTGTDDLVGTTENSIFQSTVITDMIFVNFEQLIRRDLEGVLDLGRYTIAHEGEYKKVLYREDSTYELMRITPDQFCSHALGVRLSSSSKDFDILNMMKGQVANMVQNGAKASTILTVMMADNVAKLKQDLLHIEEINDQAAASLAESEQEMEQLKIELNKDLKEFEAQLEIMVNDHVWDRKDQNETIKGEFNTYTYQDGDSNNNGIPDGQEAVKAIQERATKLEQETTKRMKIKSDEIKQLRELQQRETESRRKAATDRIKARTSSKKKK